MTKITRIKEMLKALVVSFSSVSTDKGVLVYDEDEIAEGVAVHMVDEDGNDVAVEDGDYTLEDGRIAVIADGKVTELYEVEITEEAETEEEKEEEKEEEEAEPEADVEVVEVEPEVEPEPEPEAEEIPAPEEMPEPDPRDEEIAALKATIAELEAEIAKLKAETPAPIAEEYRKVFAVKSTGDERLDRLARIASARK